MGGQNVDVWPAFGPMSSNETTGGRLRVAAVSYLNTLPFLYGLEQTCGAEVVDLQLAVPSQCATPLRQGLVDVALVPVATLPELGDVEPITTFCIGANGPVRTVCLCANEPVERIRRIYLDPDSRTSVALVQHLAPAHWGIEPDYAPFQAGGILPPLREGEAVLMIGDKVFTHGDSFSYRYDLAEAWYAYSGLPFVFAVWVAPKSVASSLSARLEPSLAWGVSHIAEALEAHPPAPHIGREAAYDYLTRCIDYRLDGDKRFAMRLFLQLLRNGQVLVERDVHDTDSDDGQ